MKNENRVGIVTTVRHEEERAINEGIIKKVFEAVPPEYEPTLYLSMTDVCDGTLLENVRNLARQDKRIKLTNVGNTMGLAYAYLNGLQTAAEDNNPKIVEIDITGSHEPNDIPKFIKGLDDKEAVFSTRFSHGGKIVRYPAQRRILSGGGTLAANLILGLGQFVPDMTSGFEAFRSEALKDIFAKQAIQKWISVVNGPGHFYQTEMRTRLIWEGHSFEMVPIVYGTDRFIDPYKLPAKIILQAFKSLILLRAIKNQLV